MPEKCKLESGERYAVGTWEGRELDICGKCPLELAGYDISQMPIAHILRGQLLGWPPETLRELVPNA
jgi:hypothetical protein